MTRPIEFLRTATAFLLCILFLPATAGALEVTLGDAEVAAWMVPRIEELRSLILKGRYFEADEIAGELLQEAEIGHGPESLEVAVALDLRVDAMLRPIIFFAAPERKGEVQEWAERAVAIKEKLLGPDHPELARSLELLGFYLLMSNLRTGGHPDAVGLVERAQAIKEAALGPHHYEIAVNLRWLSNVVFFGARDAPRAQQAYQRALAILQAQLTADDPEHILVVEMLGELAFLQGQTGEFALARPAIERAVNLAEETLDENHQTLGQSYQWLSLIRSEMGDVEDARRPMEQAVEHMRKAWGPEAIWTGEITRRLARLFMRLGDYEEARRLIEHNLGVYEKLHGPGHPLVRTYRPDLAWAEIALGDLESARELLERHWSIEEELLPSGASYCATVLATVHRALGDAERADELVARCVSWVDAAPESPAARSDNVGILLMEVGEHERARQVMQRAVDHWRQRSGGTGTRLIGALEGLSRILFLLGRRAEAMEVALEALSIDDAEHRRGARALAEAEALSYRRFSSGSDLVLSVAWEGLDAAGTLRAWDAVVGSRALVLDEMGLRNRLAIGVANSSVGRIYGSLTTARRQLSNLTVRGPAAGEDIEEFLAHVEELRRTKQKAERLLAERLAAFWEKAPMDRSGLAEAAASLGSGDAVVAFAKFDRYPPYMEEDTRIRMGGGGYIRTPMWEPIPSYAAFVLPGPAGEPRMIPLGSAAEIDELVARWREAAAGHGGAEDRAAEAAYRPAGAALREAVWTPLLPHLGDSRRVFVVPDGALQLVNLAALPVGEESYLVETGPLIHYLSAERDLAPPAQPATPGKGLLVVGGPDFEERAPFAALRPDAGPGVDGDRPTEPLVIASLEPAGGDSAAAAEAVLSFRGERSKCGDFRSMRFEPLPAAEQEADEIARLWAGADRPDGGDAQVVELSGPAATEARIKAESPGTRVLHLATHGFFLGGRCESVLDSTRGVGGLSATGQAEPVLAGESALLLSGVALAGANHRAHAGPDEEDGVLTAEEIAALDLSGVEWAVLSACDTGVGEIRAGEGVFGLRRAFQLAGARTLIMSLWSVEDESAREWMRALYEGRLEGGLSTADAVRHASLTVLRARRERGESTHPFYWASFVAAGDWN